MAFVDVRDVSMSFPGKNVKGFLALDRISLSVRKGEFVCLIGHSGCGKSTLLNMIAGLLVPTGGSILCEGVPISGPGPDRAMVFQSHALLPWMTCGKCSARSAPGISQSPDKVRNGGKGGAGAHARPPRPCNPEISL
jgi:ABC-type nitrate/sulfonate/bicarbonate transport system ATPase subunit